MEGLLLLLLLSKGVAKVAWEDWIKGWRSLLGIDVDGSQHNLTTLRTLYVIIIMLMRIINANESIQGILSQWTGDGRGGGGGRTFCNTNNMGFLHNTSCTYIARYNYALAFILTRIEGGGT